MVAPALIAGGISAVGSFIGGKKRDKAARKAYKKQRGDIAKDYQKAIDATKADQDRAIAYRDADQAAIDKRGALGYDLVKLRDDAQKAGFNPLTVLNATGAAGYDNPGVLSTPFISLGPVYENRANARAGVVQDTSNAGYFGDAISAGGSAYFAQRDSDARNALEADRTAAIREETQMRYVDMLAAGGFGAGTVTQVDGRPSGGVSGLPATAGTIGPLTQYATGLDGQPIQITNPAIQHDLESMAARSISEGTAIPDFLHLWTINTVGPARDWIVRNLPGKLSPEIRDMNPFVGGPVSGPSSGDPFNQDLSILNQRRYAEPGRITYGDWRGLSRSERLRRGLPTSEIGAQIFFNRLADGF